MADILYATGRLAEEVQWRRQGLELDPGRLSEMMSLAFTYLDLRYEQGYSELHERMLELDAQSVFVGYLEVVANLYAGNDAGTREGMQWLSSRVQDNVDFLVSATWFLTVLGDYPAAREALFKAEPRLLDPAAWPNFIEVRKSIACAAGWILMRTGDEDKGVELLNQTAAYLESTMPQYTEDPSSFNGALCYAALGHKDRAVAALEARFAHGHFDDWLLFRRLPMFEPLLGDPRFEATMQQAEQYIAQQRDEVMRMDAGGTTRL